MQSTHHKLLFSTFYVLLCGFFCVAEPQIVFGDEPGKPTEITKELLCETCHAVVRETIKELDGRTYASDVLTVLEDICKPASFRVYKFIPPKMVEGCIALWRRFQGDIEDSLVDALASSTDSESIDDQLCSTQSFCKGIEFQAPPEAAAADTNKKDKKNDKKAKIDKKNDKKSDKKAKKNKKGKENKQNDGSAKTQKDKKAKRPKNEL
eukprot:c9230_g1_i1.p1 GENE.c9230_g1_i1~~c9230_g1_i1.p1  ORF type:complete len:222 (+),score=66.28 c9230_g1_i1:43-666(+)